MGMNNLVLEITDLSFSFGKRQLFNGLSLSLNKGECLGLTGPNGSGKSTLFQVIAGLLKPEAGTIKVFDRSCKSEEDFSIARERIGFQFQDPDDQLFCPTVAEDIAFGPLNLGKSRSDTLQIVEETLDLLGLKDFAERVTHHLSEGEKRLVSLATVLAMEPELLLLDEPNSGLDEQAEDRIIDILRNLPKTMIIISHDRDFLEKICDRSVVLMGGSITEASVT